jgi:hypothetical protein
MTIGDEALDEVLDRATSRENRLTKMESALKSHDQFMEKLEKKLDTMTAWFIGLVFSIIGSVAATGIILFLHMPIK